MTFPLVSIVITNFNYERFLSSSIDSALGQRYSNVEVIVVDDGSTDGSKHILASYGNRIRWIAKENGGMPSAANAGFELSSGEIVTFLDADDVLLPHALERVVPIFEDDQVAEVDWPLQVVDAMGVPGNTIMPKSGHAWARWALEKVFPLPEPERRYGIDGLLWTIIPLFGKVVEIQEPLGLYRWHGENWFARRAMDERVRVGVEEFEFYMAQLEKWSDKLGLDFQHDSWRENSWFHQWAQALEEIAQVVRPGNTMILVDEEQWGSGPSWRGRRILPFLEKNGEYFGLPHDGRTAVRELERMRAEGAEFMVFIASTFWWLDYYGELRKWLGRNAGLVLATPRLKIYDLRSKEKC